MEELLQEIKGLSSADELLKLAQKRGFNLAADQAQEIFAQLKEDRLDVEVLESISGGAGCVDPCMPMGFEP